MKISYKKLWKLLIDREMMKKELAEQAGISTASIAKLGKNENVQLKKTKRKNVFFSFDCDVMIA